jgi:plasmid stability protein
MGQVLIRDLPDEVIAAYREEAARNSRSLEAELRARSTLLRPRTTAEVAAMRARFAQIRAMTPNVPQTPAEVIIRESRGHS